MAMTFSRYTKQYLALTRSDVAQDFPRHVFLREPNRMCSLTHNDFVKKLWVKRDNVLDSTLIHLTEPYSNSELFIIGTMNTSTLFAQRTRNLIRDIKPDVVFTQTSDKWWEGAKLLKYVKSQEEMDLAAKELNTLHQYKFPYNTRKPVFYAKWYLFNLFFHKIFKLPFDSNYFNPGLEVKYALEEAEKEGSKIVHLGNELDQPTWERLYHETRVTLFKTIRNIFKLNANYSEEAMEYYAQITNSGKLSFVESACDQYQINWFIQILDQVFPDIKRIVIDQKEEDLWKKIVENKGKKMVAVVNQMHMEGLEHHWCHSYGQKPRNYKFEEIDPIGDMNLRQMLAVKMYHALQRDIKSSLTKSPPASYSNFLITYYREGNPQYEHRNM